MSERGDLRGNEKFGTGEKDLTSRYEKLALLEYAEARLARSESNV
jgi:predicted methyltransferase